ncbi:MAG TPA: response regulator [Syntrophaceae bacterium]|nr:response regulator [Syntrophaceae bacterium]
MNVLVVDDDHGMCKTLCDILSVKGYGCEAAYSGEEAIQRVRQKDYHCILMDIKMPGINGVEAFQTIRKMTTNTVIILMTAYFTDPSVLEAKRQGILAVLPKPLNITSFLNFLSTLEKGKAILIVDDDPHFCWTMGNILKEQDFKIQAALSSEEAVEKITKDGVDIVLLDMKLNGLTGLDVLKLMRKAEPNIQVILITGYYQEMAEAIKDALDIKAYTCLYKPLDMDKLFRTLEEIYRKKWQQLLGQLSAEI